MSKTYCHCTKLDKVSRTMLVAEGTFFVDYGKLHSIQNVHPSAPKNWIFIATISAMKISKYSKSIFDTTATFVFLMFLLYRPNWSDA